MWKRNGKIVFNLILFLSCFHLPQRQYKALFQVFLSCFVRFQRVHKDSHYAQHTTWGVFCIGTNEEQYIWTHLSMRPLWSISWISVLLLPCCSTAHVCFCWFCLWSVFFTSRFFFPNPVLSCLPLLTSTGYLDSEIVCCFMLINTFWILLLTSCTCVCPNPASLKVLMKCFR